MSFLQNIFKKDVSRTTVQQYLESSVVESRQNFEENNKYSNTEPAIYMNEDNNLNNIDNNTANINSFVQSSYNITAITNAPKGNAEKVFNRMSGFLNTGFTSIQDTLTQKNKVVNRIVGDKLTLKDFESYLAKCQLLKSELQNSENKSDL